MLYGDSTFTGRTIIWDFANMQIAKKPLLGWGYQSFWLVGPDAPSIVEAPGWVKDMVERGDTPWRLNHSSVASAA